MLKRIVSASVIALAVAASTGSAALAASAAGTVATTGSTVQVAAPPAATQQTSPNFECVPGIISTVCSAVFGPICKDRCMAAPAAQTQAQAPAAASSATAARSATSAPAISAATTPTLYCEPTFQVLCTVLGLTLCSLHPCGGGAVTATAASPTFYCDVPVLCYVIYLTICRNGCAVNGASATPAEPAVNPIGDLCTVNMRPNPFCWVP